MKVGRWSTTAASNNNTPPDGWPEGQAPSTVNDCAREMMASIRTMLNDMSFIDLAHTPTQTSSTTFTLPSNVVSYYEVGRRVKAFDGANTFYGTVISSSFTTVTGITLRLDSGALTTSLSSIAVSVLSGSNRAIPESVYRADNLWTNGQLDIWQRGTSFNISGSAQTAFTADRLRFDLNATASLNITRSERSANASNVPTLAQCGLFLNHSICISVSAADAAIAASDYARLVFPMIGYDWRNIAHKPNIVSFWVNSNRTGTYCLALQNAGHDRSYVNEFIISGSSTWEKKTFTIPEATTTGTWNYSNSIGLAVHITLAAGTAFQTTNAGEWTSTDAIATSNQINFLGSAGHTIRFADFRIYEGVGEVPVEIKPYNVELEKCRYTYKRISAAATAGPVIAGHASTVNTGLYIYLFDEMLNVPSISYPPVSSITIGNHNNTQLSCSAISSNRVNNGSLLILATQVGTGNLSLGWGTSINLDTGAFIAFDADLY